MALPLIRLNIPVLLQHIHQGNYLISAVSLFVAGMMGAALIQGVLY
ncbi:hypothetical protein UMNK88_1008 [Escherichia coli UMNK88]|nr:hypothetical protein UMNK88_1008 [Escherichia coli UMNK88]EKH25658.1 putative protein StfE [Escherichia coli FDA504]